MDKTVRVAVVGVGFFGERHAKTFSELPEVELVAVVDPDIHRAKEVAARFGCQPFSEISALIGKIDAASIATPTAAHHPIATSLLQNGIDILIEKPIASTREEADEINQRANQNGRIVQVGHLEQFNPAVIELKKHLSLPRFIECHRMGPFLERAANVSVVLDLMIHDIEIVLSLIASEPVEVRAIGRSLVSNEIDFASARLAFANGAVANITASRVSAERLRKISVLQKDAYLSLDYLQQTITCCRPVSKEKPTPSSLATETVTVTPGDPLRSEFLAFIDSVKTRRPPMVSGKEAGRALAVALQIIDQIKTSHASS